MSSNLNLNGESKIKAVIFSLTFFIFLIDWNSIKLLGEIS